MRKMYRVEMSGIVGAGNKQNDLIYLGPRHPHHSQGNLIYFGGDIQDFSSLMLGRTDSAPFISRSLEATAHQLHNKFPHHNIWVIKASSMLEGTYSSYKNFVKSDDHGIPQYFTDFAGFLHLVSLLRSAIKVLRYKLASSQLINVSDNDGRDSDVTALKTSHEEAKRYILSHGANRAATNCDDTNLDDTNLDDTNRAATNCDDTNRAATNLDDTNSAATNLDATNCDATNLDDTNRAATNIDATNCDATNLDATNLDATNLDATNRDDTNRAATNLDATNLDDTNIDATNHAATNIDATNRDEVVMTLPTTLIGFSKGCVVLNQFLYEIYSAQCDERIKMFLDHITSWYWLDGGHSGGVGTWITNRTVLSRLVEYNWLIHVHVSPYQIQDEVRFWIGIEEEKFSSWLVELGVEVRRVVHFSDQPPSLENHFKVLDEFT